MGIKQNEDEQKMHKSKKSKPKIKETNLQVKDIVLNKRWIKKSYGSVSESQLISLRRKEDIIANLSNRLRDKIGMDLETKVVLQQYDDQKIKQLRAIETEIEIINKYNEIKVKQLKQVQKKVIGKIEKQLQRDLEEEERLRKDYEILLKEDKKIYITKQVKKIKDREDWLAIQREQKKMEIAARAFQKGHLAIARSKSHRIIDNNKSKNKEDDQKNSKTIKKQRKKRDAAELKQMGRQFLEHAKKVQAEKLKSSIRVMDVYRKSIDYLPQLKKMMANNVENLSCPMQQNEQGVTLKDKRRLRKSQQIERAKKTMMETALKRIK